MFRIGPITNANTHGVREKSSEKNKLKHMLRFDRSRFAVYSMPCFDKTVSKRDCVFGVYSVYFVCKRVRHSGKNEPLP